MRHTASDIDIYPVGLLHDLAQFVHAIDRPHARRKFRCALSMLLGRIRKGDWGYVRNYFNGYLAEHAIAGSRAGHGWTRGRAYRDLMRHLNSDPRNPS